MKFRYFLEKFEKEELTPAQKATRQRKKNKGVSTLASNVSRLKNKISIDLKSSDEVIKSCQINLV